MSCYKINKHISVLLKLRFINATRHIVALVIYLNRKTWSTRLDEEAEKEIKALIKKSGLKEAEILRRLIVIGLKNVRQPADLLKV